MDNLTHSLTGIMLSRAGLDRFTPRSAWLLFFAANAPDSDAISALAGAGNYFQYHRWLTHSLAALPFMAILPVLAVALIFRQKLPWVRAWLVSLVGVASHLLLDFTNPYGIRILLPFSDEWPGLDATHVIDVWIWGALLLAIAAPAISRLVSSEIGGTTKTGRGWAIFALTFLFVYDSGRLLLHRRAINVQESRLYNGLPPKRVLLMPTPVNPLLWQGFVETDNFWSIHDVNLAEEFDPTVGRVIYKTEGSAAIERAQQHPLFRCFGKFAKTPRWTVSPAIDPGGPQKIELQDLRFGFTVTGSMQPDGRVDDVSFQF